MINDTNITINNPDITIDAKYDLNLHDFQTKNNLIFNINGNNLLCKKQYKNNTNGLIVNHYSINYNNITNKNDVNMLYNLEHLHP